MERTAKIELVEVLRERYQRSTKVAKSRILDELVEITGYHRKYALRLLRQPSTPREGQVPGRRRIYNDAVKEALVVLWEASDRICGKRLKAILPELLESLESHKHLTLDPCVRELLLAVSAASIDRLLRSIRSQANSRNRRRPVRKTRSLVLVKTFADWEEVKPGNLEIDFVAHCGGTLVGSFIHSLVMTDVSSGWTEATPMLVREQSLVVEGLEVLRGQLPIPLLGINSDNDSAFINDSVITYCSEQKIAFTRSRPYRKNDQAWIEQKNGAVIRRFVGHSRYSGAVAGQTLANLYGNLRLYVNFFQPSFKLLSKHRERGKVKKFYAKPKTPCDRLLADLRIESRDKEALLQKRAELDPIVLLHQIRLAQSALALLASPETVTDEQEHELDQFLAQLPRLWQQGEVRPTHRQLPARARDYRTRKDPFEGVWSELLSWLEREPDATGKSLFARLQEHYPEKFTDGQLRTLQRRVRQWRHIMVKQLIFKAPPPRTPMT
jgi:hypothetical protein